MGLIRGITKAKTARHNRARLFVEKETGRGTATAKLVSPKKAYLVAANYFRSIGEEPMSPSTFHFIQGKNPSFALPKGKSKRKQLIVLGKKEPMGVEIHERAHSAFLRLHRIRGKKSPVFLDEAFAYSIELEWLKSHNPKKFRSFSNPNRCWGIINGLIRADSTMGQWKVNKFGLAVAGIIASKVKSQEERALIRKELLNSNIREPKQLAEFLKKRLY